MTAANNGNNSGYSATTTTVKEVRKNDDDDVGGCEWIPWTHPVVQAMPDPTRIFSLLVIGIMLLRYLEAHEWQISLIFSGFLLNPWVVLFFSISTIPVMLHHLQTLPMTPHSSASASAALPVYDRWAAEWYWWNAWLYHAVMDGGSGTFQLVPVVVQQYSNLDLRFVNHHVVPWIVGVIELFVMQPLCIATFLAILYKSPLRFPLELVTSTFQLMGMIVFVGAEVYEGQLNVPALDPVGIPGNRWANVKPFDFYHFTYYWFGFWFCNLIWGCVPYYRIMRAVGECKRSFQQQQQKAKSE
jgi:EXPERA (EXPanded EBP superfamily)